VGGWRHDETLPLPLPTHAESCTYPLVIIYSKHIHVGAHAILVIADHGRTLSQPATPPATPSVTTIEADRAATTTTVTFTPTVTFTNPRICQEQREEGASTDARYIPRDQWDEQLSAGRSGHSLMAA
jgi:hypothetical protein